MSGAGWKVWRACCNGWARLGRHLLQYATGLFAPVAAFVRKERRLIGQRDGESLLPEIIAIGGFLTLLWIGIALGLHREYHAAEAAAIQATGNLARAFEESTRRTIGQIDQVLLSARAFYAVEGEHFNFNEWARTQTLPDQMTAAIGMADSKGHVFADTKPILKPVSIADRAHFKAQIDPTRDELFISDPVRGRVTGRDTIQFTRKLLGPHGEFAGVTVFSLDCEMLSRFYQTVNIGNGFVALQSADGIVLARGPLLRQMIGVNVAKSAVYLAAQARGNGSVRSFSQSDGIERIASFRRLKDYPITVVVAEDTDSVFARYRLLRRHVVQTGAIITAAVILLGFFWLQQKRRSLASRRALDITLETISQGILMVDPKGHIPVVNRRAAELLGLPDEPLTSCRISEAARIMARAADESRQEAREPMVAGKESANLSDADERFETRRADGSVVEVINHRLPGGGSVHTYTDVTEQRLADAQIRYLAHHDSLTGLSNRAQQREQIAEFLGRHGDPDHFSAFIMIDIDSFKGVNDTFGHDVGDQLLVEVARRLQSVVREDDLVARVGGDEFAIFQPNIRRTEDGVRLAERILQRLDEPALVAGYHMRIGASIGIAFHPRDGRDIQMLFKNSDIALYSAKASGRGTYRCFDPEMTRAVKERRHLESDLRQALADNELNIHYQPQFSAGTLEIVGFEALARWQTPLRGYIPPGSFIPIAEQCGLINKLGLWMIERACAFAATWRPAYRLAVNVSTVQLSEGTLEEQIFDILKRTGFPANLLDIEVTESVLADDNRRILETLAALRACGVRIVLDDFGTRYSSLSYLRQFSFDKIKIDKSFVQSVPANQGAEVILEAIVGMSLKLGLAVVGEGVETRQQLMVLRRIGCSEVQGYLLGRPIAEEGMAEFLSGNVRHLGRARRMGVSGVEVAS